MPLSYGDVSPRQRQFGWPEQQQRQGGVSQARGYTPPKRVSPGNVQRRATFRDTGRPQGGVASSRQREAGQQEPVGWPEGLAPDFDPVRDRPRMGDPDFIARMRLWRDNMALWARTREGSQKHFLPPGEGFPGEERGLPPGRRGRIRQPGFGDIRVDPRETYGFDLQPGDPGYEEVQEYLRWREQQRREQQYAGPITLEETREQRRRKRQAFYGDREPGVTEEELRTGRRRQPRISTAAEDRLMSRRYREGLFG